MFHKFFQWRYLRKRNDHRSRLRDIEVHPSCLSPDQLSKDSDSTKLESAPSKKRALKFICWGTVTCIAMAFTIWFMLASYTGLRLLD